jgi:leucyl-tRNA---protein transferase
MARLVERMQEPPHPCPYLPGRVATLDIAVLLDVTPAELGVLLSRGWRRFGPTYFRPVCAGCRECVSLRVPTATFQPSRSQKRARRLAARLARTVGPPVVDDERLALYARWHAERERRRGWDANAVDAGRYGFEFAFDHPAVREVTFRDPERNHRLVGVGHVVDALSAVIFFWDPDLAPPSLGVAHIVTLIDEASARGLSYVYLGYRVADCPSLAYKGRYAPHETLATPPGEHPAVWRRPG